MASLEPKSAQDSRGRESSPVASEQQTLDTGDVPPAAGPVPPPNASTTPPDVPYSAFGKRDKWIIVALTSFASLFSPLTANIYFPAIPTISRAFGKSVELINLTVTVYMVLQGIAPMVWGNLSDRRGRRPLFLLCLLILALSCVGLALVPTNAYWLLMLLRCIQAAGSASTVALAAGAIGDIATPAERGGFFGVSGTGTLLGTAIGPVIGGGLAQGLGWRSIFWFLCIASIFAFIVTFLLLPETLRALVGDGSIPPPRAYRTPLKLVKPRYQSSSGRPAPKPFQNPFALFFYPDVATLLFFNGIFYSVFYGVTATTSALFEGDYTYLSQTDLGLVYLSIGGGMIFGTVITGKLLDRDYRIIKSKLSARKEDLAEKGTVSGVFPIEKARLRSTPIYLAIYVAAVVGYGWSLESRTSIAVPLILQFIIGYTIVALMNTAQTLLVDLLPGRGSSITAANNLVRCSLGAGMVSVIDIIISSVGQGWAYTILGALCLAVGPLIYLEERMGPKWRAQRAEKGA